MISSRRLTALLVIAALLAPSVLRAQRIAAAGARPRVLVVRTGGTAAPMRETAEIVPSSLAAAEKIAMARGALNPGEEVSAVDKVIRLTAAHPAPGGAGLVTQWARDVTTGFGSNLIRLKNSGGVSGENPSVAVNFTPDKDHHPVLVDFIVSVTGTVKVYIAAHGEGEHRTLAPGDHHVIILVVPNKSWFLSARLQVEPGGPPAQVGVHAVELTTLK